MEESLLEEAPRPPRAFARLYSIERLGLVSTAIALIFVALLLWRSIPAVVEVYKPSNKPGGDFLYLLGAGRVLLDGEKQYLYRYPPDVTKWTAEHDYIYPSIYPYAPAAAIATAGITAFSDQTSFDLWRIAVLICTGALGFCAAYSVQNWAWRIAIFLAAFCWEPILLNAKIGQTGVFVAALTALGAILFLRNRHVGAVVMGILALKPTAFLGPALMVYPEQMSVWLRLFGTAALLVFLPFIWLGSDALSGWFTILFDRAAIDVTGGHFYNQGLSSLAGHSNVLVILLGCVLLVAAALLTERIRRSLGIEASIAFALTVGGLINPHSLLYDWGTAFVVLFMVRRLLRFEVWLADLAVGILLISLFLAGQAAWHLRSEGFALRPLTVWAILVGAGIVVAAFWPRREAPNLAGAC